MRPPIRSAALRPSIENGEDEDAQDITNILNDQAENATRASLRKRKRASGSSEATKTTTRKRVQLGNPTLSASDPTSAPASPSRRRSGRLQARKSLGAPTPVSGRNIFEVPDEAEAEEEQVRAPPRPVKKLRQLKKRNQDTSSPFKNLGELLTNSNAMVNLDSPRKTGKPRRPPAATNPLAKINKSLQRSGLRQVVARTPPKNTVQADGEDRSGDHEGNAEDSRIQEPDQAAVSKAVPRAPPRESPRRRARASNNRFLAIDQVESSPAVPASNSRDDREVGSQHVQADQSHRPAPKTKNPLAEAARRTEVEVETPPARAPVTSPRKRRDRIRAAEENMGPKEVNGDDGREQPIVQDNATNGIAAGDHEPDEDEIDEPPQIVKRRPMTEAEKRNAEIAAEEKEARRQQMIDEELFGIEIAVQLHGCNNDWTNALLAAAEIVRDRGSSILGSTLGRGCEREFRAMTTAYERMTREEGPWRRLAPTERETLDRLIVRCEDLGKQTVAPNGRRNPERKEIVKDIYEHLIPCALKMAKWALKARFRNETLSRQALTEIHEVLEIAYDLMETARVWRPRPNLDNGVKSKTQMEIKPRVAFILEKYQGVIHESGRTRYVDDLAARAAENRARQEAQHREWQESVRSRYGRGRSSAPGSTTGAGWQPSSTPQSALVDIDDINVEEDPAAGRHHSRQAPPVEDATQAKRPRAQREATEEIPAPSEPPLSEEDLGTLIRALRKFRFNLETRWEDIMDGYGGLGGPFAKYDLDEVVAKAKWLKQTMASQLDNELDDSWDFLRSVGD